jgi:hypothetical protein
MTEPQLNLLGDQAQPVDDQLGPVQKAAVRLLRKQGTLARVEAGQLAHAHRSKHSGDEVCLYCGTDGALLLESLIRRGMAEPIPGTGDVRVPQPVEAKPAPAPHDPFPEGY